MAKGPRFTSSRRSSAPSGLPLPLIPSAFSSISASAKTTTWPISLVREVAKSEIDKLENRGYADNGIAAFKEAAAGFMKKVVQRLARSRKGNQPRDRLQAGPGDDPGRIHQSRRHHADDRARLSRRRHAYQVLRRQGSRSAPCARRTTSIPISTASPTTSKSKAKLLVINYPNSPTGAVATREFYRRVIDFAVQERIIVVQDAAHILLSYGEPPLSFLQMDGAREVGVEIHSMSKGFNMIGWRMAFVAGHPKIVQAFADVKDNSDSGQFMAIQQAAAAALRSPRDRRSHPRQIPSPPRRNWWTH